MVKNIKDIVKDIDDTMLNMVKEILRHEKGIKDKYHDTDFIPLQLLKEFSQYKFIVIYPNGTIAILTDKEIFYQFDLIVEVKMAIIADLSMRYFEEEDI